MLTTPLKSDNRNDASHCCPPANPGPQCPLHSYHQPRWFVVSILNGITRLISHAAVVEQAYAEQTAVAKIERRSSAEPDKPGIWSVEKMVGAEPDTPVIWSVEKRVGAEPDTPGIWSVEKRAAEEPPAAVKSKQLKRAHYATPQPWRPGVWA